MLNRRLLKELLAGGLDRTWDERSRFGLFGRGARGVVRRGTRPITSRQARVDGAIAAVLDDDARVRALEAIEAAPLAAAEAVVVDTELGPLLFHAGDEVITPWVREHRVWEVAETAFLRATLRPGHVFVDCGANVGWFSVLASQLVGRGGTVIAVEPEQRNLALLRRNLWQHAYSELIVFPCAAGRGRGHLALHTTEANRGDHQTHALDASAGGRHVTLVPVAPLDELLGGGRVDVVKIDVQGYDHEVIEGMSATLTTSPDVALLVEFWLTGMEERGIDPAAVLARYRDLGMHVSLLTHDGSPRQVGDAEVLDVAEDGGTRVVNLIMRRA